MQAPLQLTKCAIAALLFSISINSYATAYDQLIVQARQGDAAPVLAFLQEQSLSNTLSPSQINDWLIVSGWTGNDAQTIEIYQQYRQKTALQANALATVGHAYRNLQRWDFSASVLALAIEKDPSQSEWYLNAAGALADGGQYELAREKMAQFEARFPTQKVPALLNRVYIERAAKKPIDALIHAQNALTLAPNDRQVQTVLLASLRNAGLAERALSMVEKNQWDWLEAPTRRGLQMDYAAEMVRVSTTATSAEAARFEVANRALAYYAQILAQWQQATPDAQLPADVHRARLDRLIPLMYTKNATQVLAEYAELKAQDPVLPDYALLNVASAMLQLRQPAQALELYKGIESRTKSVAPELYEAAQLGVFYGLIETEQQDKARAYADEYFAEQPPFRHIAGGTLPVPNPRWSEAQRESSSADLYADRLAAAQEEQKAQLALGPGDAHNRMALASTYRNRGLLRHSAQELRIAQANENPSAGALMIEQAGVALQLRDWQTAKALTMDVAERFPEDPQALRALREWRLSQKAELNMGVQWSDSNSPTALGEGAMRYNVLVYSAPIQYDWRLFVGGDRSSGRYEEGYGQFNQVRGGVQWRLRDTDAALEISTIRSSGRSYTGLRIEGNHQFDDHWQISADAARNSAQVPLRALRAGVTANEANVGVKWQAHESTGVKVSAGWMNYSDGNHRLSWMIDGYQRLLTRNRFQLDANLSLYTSSNSHPGGPYFAPSRDWSVLPGLTARHLIWREYERVWRQELSASVGTYHQRNFGSGAYQELRYGQKLRWNDTTEFGFQTGLTWRPYDGIRERAVFFGLNLSHLF